jgi:hypothetical protein
MVGAISLRGLGAGEGLRVGAGAGAGAGVDRVRGRVARELVAGTTILDESDAGASRALAIVTSVVVSRSGSGNNSALTSFGLAP